jgi:K+-transporting ATPase ATPase B chain
MKNAISIWDTNIIRQAVLGAFTKLDPRKMLKNPVMFVVEVGSSDSPVFYS